MQYRGRLQIAKGNQQQPLNRMRHASSQALQALRLSVLLLVCGLAACSETLTAESSPPTSQQLQRGYDKTLTKAEQQAVISDMQSATAKKQGEASGDDAAASAAKTGENTN
jgi:hypothetical protein